MIGEPSSPARGMRKAVRRISAAGGWLPARLARWLKGPGVRILTYHRVAAQPEDRLCVPPSQFKRQMEVLSSGSAPVISLSRLITAAGGGGISSAVALTFDDGYDDLYHHAFPVLKRLGLPATVFVVPEFVEGRGFLDRFGPGQKFLDWEMLREMEAAGIEAGSHGLTHRELIGFHDKELDRELEKSLLALKSNLDDRPRWLAYPRGRFNPEVKTAARRAGYLGAVTVLPGANRAPFDLFGLRRTEISRDDTLFDFRLKVAGAFDLGHAVWQRRGAAGVANFKEYARPGIKRFTGKHGFDNVFSGECE